MRVVTYSVYFVFVFCVVRNISATATPVGVEICVMVHIGPRHVFSHFVGGFARVPKSKILVD